jgi:hypothetical protein
MQPLSDILQHHQHHHLRVCLFSTSVLYARIVRYRNLQTLIYLIFSQAASKQLRTVLTFNVHLHVYFSYVVIFSARLSLSLF